MHKICSVERVVNNVFIIHLLITVELAFDDYAPYLIIQCEECERPLTIVLTREELTKLRDNADNKHWHYAFTDILESNPCSNSTQTAPNAA